MADMVTEDMATVATEDMAMAATEDMEWDMVGFTAAAMDATIKLYGLSFLDQ